MYLKIPGKRKKKHPPVPFGVLTHSQVKAFIFLLATANSWAPLFPRPLLGKKSQRSVCWGLLLQAIGCSFFLNVLWNDDFMILWNVLSTFDSFVFTCLFGLFFAVSH